MDTTEHSKNGSELSKASPAEQAHRAEPSKALPESWVEKIFERLLAYYGRQFADMWASADVVSVKRVWAQELGHLKPEQIASGLKACLANRFPPSLPEFLMLCRPAIDNERGWSKAVFLMMSYRQGIQVVWPDNRLYWAAVAIGNDFGKATWEQQRARWQNACEYASDAEVPTPSDPYKQLGYEQKPLDQEKVRQTMA